MKASDLTASGPIAAICLILMLAVPAYAQAPLSRFEAGAGVLWVNGISFGRSDATETAPGGNDFTLFTSDSRLVGAAAVGGRIGVRLSPRLQAESSVWYRRPTLRVALADDAEGIADIEVTEKLTEIMIEGALVADLGDRTDASRTIPFVTAGGGYLRQLHAERTLVDTGQTLFGGAGLNWMFSPRGSTGLRIEGRATWYFGGAALDEDTHLAPAAGASIFVRF